MFSLFKTPSEHRAITEPAKLIPKTITREWFPDTETPEGREQHALLRREHPVRLLCHRMIATQEARKLRGEVLSSTQEAELAKLRRMLGLLNNLDAYIAQHHAGEQTLRGRQIDVFEDIRLWLETWGKHDESEGDALQNLHNKYRENGTFPGPKGYVRLPTGVGKTVLFLELIEALNAKTLIAVPTVDLVAQTYKKMEQFAPDVQARSGQVHGGSKQLSQDFTIITYSSLVAQVEKGAIVPSTIDFLVLDEAHRGLSELRIGIIEKFSSAITLGFTATDTFNEEKAVSNILPDLVHSMETREAIEEGSLCSVRTWIARVSGLDISNILVAPNGEYNESDYIKAMEKTGMITSAIELYKKEFSQEKALIFCPGIYQSNKTAQAFRDAGITSSAYHSDMSKDELKKVMDDFEAGKISVLTGDQKFLEGFDDPSVSVVLNLKPTNSLINATQRGGRALRLLDSNPQKLATIVDFLPETSNPRHPPILFCNVLGGAQILTPASSIRETSERETSKTAKEKHDIIIEGLTVTTDVDEVMEIGKREIAKESKKAPEGWLNTADLKKLFKSAHTTLTPLAEEIIKELESEGGKREDFTGGFLDLMGRMIPFYAPVIATKLSERFQKPPEGWIHTTDLLHSVKSTLPFAMPIIEEMIKELKAEGMSQEELTGEFVGVKNQSIPFYAPIIQKKLKEMFQKPPEGWMHLTDITTRFRTTGSTVRILIEDVREDLEDEGKKRVEIAKKFVNQSGQPTLFYAPELIERLSEVFQKSPEGWMNKNDLKKLLKSSHERIVSMIETILQEYEAQGKKGEKRRDIARKFLSSDDRLTTFYSPFIVQKLAEKLEKPPEEWGHRSDLAKRFKRKPTIIAPLIEEILVKYEANGGKREDVAKTFLEKMGRPAVFYSPLVITALREMVERGE